MKKHDADNRGDQLNPNNPKYWKARGLPVPSPSPSGQRAGESTAEWAMREAREVRERRLAGHEQDCELRTWGEPDDEDDDDLGPQCTCVGLDMSIEPMDKD